MTGSDPLVTLVPRKDYLSFRTLLSKICEGLDGGDEMPFDFWSQVVDGPSHLMVLRWRVRHPAVELLDCDDAVSDSLCWSLNAGSDGVQQVTVLEFRLELVLEGPLEFVPGSDAASVLLPLVLRVVLEQQGDAQ